MIETAPLETVPRRPDRVIADHAAGSPGPTLVVVGALHANEPAGLEAAERVHAAITIGRVSLARGRFVALRGNLAALRDAAESPWQRRRYIDEDLNRVFRDLPSESPRHSAEQRERDQLSDALGVIAANASGPVFLLDLHTVSSDSPAFVAVEDSLPARRFAMNFPLPKVLGMEEVLEGLLIDHATRHHKCVACIAEAGRHDDPRAVDVHEALVLLALSAIGLTHGQASTTSDEPPYAVAAAAAAGRSRHFYDLRQRAPIRHPSFKMQPGASAFSRVVAGRTVVAVERSCPLAVEHSGLLFLPNRQSQPRVGDDAFFVIARVGRGWLWLSALVRRQRWVHRWIPRLLPGVRQRPGEPNTILIAPEYAAVLKREMLHLLGYRLIRWTTTPQLSVTARLVQALTGIASSVIALIRNALRGAERAALPDERPTDWVATRRHLDLDPPR